jgi:hypothetical protein
MWEKAIHYYDYKKSRLLANVMLKGVSNETLFYF